VIGQGRQRLLQIGRRQDERNSGCCGRPRQIYGANSRMRQRTAYERDVKHAWQLEISYVLPLAHEQPAILAPRHGASHKAIR
jgi:hypothetical protein